MYEYYGNNYNNDKREKDIEVKSVVVDKEKPKKKGGFVKMIATGLVIGIVAGGAFQGIDLAADYVRERLNVDENLS